MRRGLAIIRLRFVGRGASLRSIVRTRPQITHSKTNRSGCRPTLGELRTNAVGSPQWGHRGDRGWVSGITVTEYDSNCGSVNEFGRSAGRGCG
jgi:hypothetical protein